MIRPIFRRNELKENQHRKFTMERTPSELPWGFLSRLIAQGGEFCMCSQFELPPKLATVGGGPRVIRLIRILRFSCVPLTLGERNSRLTRAAPVSCPTSVILPGSPPKESMFFLTQRTAAAMSLMPRLPPKGSVLSKVDLVRRKPGRTIICKENYPHKRL